jgi:hypothetical protein
VSWNERALREAVSDALQSGMVTPDEILEIVTQAIIEDGFIQVPADPETKN